MGGRGGAGESTRWGPRPGVLGARCHSFPSEGLRIGPSSGQGRRPRECSADPREARRPEQNLQVTTLFDKGIRRDGQGAVPQANRGSHHHS